MTYAGRAKVANRTELVDRKIGEAEAYWHHQRWDVPLVSLAVGVPGVKEGVLWLIRLPVDRC